MAPLSRDRIVETARDLADREGLDAVTLRRLATELDVHVTSLYNHVATRDAIVDGIVELLISEANLPGRPRNWEEWVRGFVSAVGALAVAHPGAFTALERRPVQGERALSSFEVALANWFGKRRPRFPGAFRAKSVLWRSDTQCELPLQIGGDLVIAIRRDPG